MREEQNNHWLTFQLWIMGIYLHASVHLPPVCLSCLNQRPDLQHRHFLLPARARRAQAPDDGWHLQQAEPQTAAAKCCTLINMSQANNMAQEYKAKASPERNGDKFVPQQWACLCRSSLCMGDKRWRSWKVQKHTNKAPLLLWIMSELWGIWLDFIFKWTRLQRTGWKQTSWLSECLRYFIHSIYANYYETCLRQSFLVQNFWSWHPDIYEQVQKIVSTSCLLCVHSALFDSNSQNMAIGYKNIGLFIFLIIFFYMWTR